MSDRVNRSALRKGRRSVPLCLLQKSVQAGTFRLFCYHLCIARQSSNDEHAVSNSEFRLNGWRLPSSYTAVYRIQSA
jgi:hypothetical protein